VSFGRTRRGENPGSFIPLHEDPSNNYWCVKDRRTPSRVGMHIGRAADSPDPKHHTPCE
jgi:hypothetical protein